MTPDEIPDWITARAERHFRDAARNAARYTMGLEQPEAELWPILRAALADVLTVLGHRTLPPHSTPARAPLFAPAWPAPGSSAYVDWWHANAGPDGIVRNVTGIVNTVTGERIDLPEGFEIHWSDAASWIDAVQADFLRQWKEHRQSRRPGEGFQLSGPLPAWSVLAAPVRPPETTAERADAFSPLEAVQRRLAGALGVATSGLLDSAVLTKALMAAAEQQQRDAAAQAAYVAAHGGAEAEMQIRPAGEPPADLVREFMKRYRWRDIVVEPGGKPESWDDQAWRFNDGTGDFTIKYNKPTSADVQFIARETGRPVEHRIAPSDWHNIDDCDRIHPEVTL